MDKDELISYHNLIKEVPVADNVIEYAVNFVSETRPDYTSQKLIKDMIDWGAGPRASSYLILGAKAADLYPPGILGTVMGVVDIGRGIGWAAGGILSGLLFDIFGDYILAYWVAAFLVLFSIAAQWAVKIVEPKQIIS